MGAGGWACENCVVVLASPPPPPVLGPALKDNGFRLRSSQFLRFGTWFRRTPAGGGVATQLDAPRVTVLSPPPTCAPTPPPHLHPRLPGRRAALVTRMGLPQFPRGGLFFLPGCAARVVQGPGRVSPAFPAGVLPFAPPQGSYSEIVWREQCAAGIDGRKKEGSFPANTVVRAGACVGVTITLLSHCLSD